MNDEQETMTISSFIVHRSSLRNRLLALYDALYAHFGHEPHWWPIYSDTPQFEILIGAVLVQQTRWETVEAAVVRLRDAGLLAPSALAAADTAALAALIRPCAFHAQKAPGLQAICRHIVERYGGDVAALLAQARAPLRAELLALPRIGPETADTIMLYAGDHPAFIVDAYARRLFARLDLLPCFDFARARYDAIQALIEGALTTTGDRRPTTNDEDRRLEMRDWRLTADGNSISHLQSPISRSQSLRHFLWDLHALIIEECIHHCLAADPRQDRPGAKRAFVDPRKCAAHCVECQGCPLRAICAFYQPRAKEPASP
jgi:endonuclease III related protein